MIPFSVVEKIDILTGIAGIGFIVVWVLSFVFLFKVYNRNVTTISFDGIRGLGRAAIDRAIVCAVVAAIPGLAVVYLIQGIFYVFIIACIVTLPLSISLIVLSIKKQWHNYMKIASVSLLVFSLFGVYGNYELGTIAGVKVAQENTSTTSSHRPSDNMSSQNSNSSSQSSISTNKDNDLSSATQYVTYVNPTFGFTLEYPASFIKDTANNNSINLHSKDNQASVTAYAEVTSSALPVQTQYEQEMNNINGIIGYHVAGDTWYVITWENAGNLYYRKVIFKNNVRNQFEITYPKSQKNLYTPMVEHIEAGFIPGSKG